MSERMDHAGIARGTLKNFEWLLKAHDDTAAVAIATAAQVHATLALVEQQRIANLIALVALSGNAGIQESDYDEGSTIASEGLHALIEYERVPLTLGMPENGEDEVPVIRPHIKAALGLEAAS